MRICIAQTESKPGDIASNLQNHLRMIERAIELRSDLIVFPELSMINYEPELAREHAYQTNDSALDSIQKMCDGNQIVVGVGMPTMATNGIHISMLIFRPNDEKLIYSKRQLHKDEEPYFIPGSSDPVMEFLGCKIALGICYETLNQEHFLLAKKGQAEVFIASVAKPERGLFLAESHFAEMSKMFNIAILMANSVGPADNFVSMGSSAVWNAKGEKLGQLDGLSQGLLVYDTKSGTARIHFENTTQDE